MDCRFFSEDPHFSKSISLQHTLLSVSTSAMTTKDLKTFLGGFVIFFFLSFFDFLTFALYSSLSVCQSVVFLLCYFLNHLKKMKEYLFLVLTISSIVVILLTIRSLITDNNPRLVENADMTDGLTSMSN